MAFNWKALAERLDPRKLNWAWTKPARDWAVANRTVVLSTSVALLAGLWGGAVLGRVSTGAPAFDFAQLGSIGAAQNARDANAKKPGQSPGFCLAVYRTGALQGGERKGPPLDVHRLA